MVPSPSVEVDVNVHASPVHDEVNDAVGATFGLGAATAGTTIDQPMPLVPAIVELAMVPGQLAAVTMTSPVAAVIRPVPVPTAVLRAVTVPGNVQPVFDADLSDQ